MPLVFLKSSGARDGLADYLDSRFVVLQKPGLELVVKIQLVKVNFGRSVVLFK